RDCRRSWGATALMCSCRGVYRRMMAACRTDKSRWRAGKGGAMCLAVPGQIVDVIDRERHMARVSVASVRRIVNVALLDDCDPPLAQGDWVLIHVGFALSRVDEAEALATL